MEADESTDELEFSQKHRAGIVDRNAESAKLSGELS